MLKRRAAVVATGWVGDTLACTAAAISLAEERDFLVDFYMKWPQIQALLSYDERFNTHLYKDNGLGRIRLWSKLKNYDLIVKEPSQWSYNEPFTAELRRMAGCIPTPEFDLPVGNVLRHHKQIKPGKPLIVISRDMYTRAFGRDVDLFVRGLEPYFEISWVGLPPDRNSRKGKELDLMQDAEKICMADCFVGPEGGMLWLAGGLGQRTIYFTERIQHVKETLGRGDFFKALGNENIFPNGRHVALPLHCTNDEAIHIIVNSFN